MATFYIAEFSELALDTSNNSIPVEGALIANQKVTIAGTSAQSSAFNSATKYIGITSDTPCQFLIGSNPTAVATSRYVGALPAPVYIKVNASEKIAVISQQ